MSVPISASVQVMMVSSTGRERQTAAAAAQKAAQPVSPIHLPTYHAAAAQCEATRPKAARAGCGARRCSAHRPGAGIQCRLISGGSAAAACGHSLPSPPAPRCGFAAKQSRQDGRGVATLGGSVSRRQAAAAARRGIALLVLGGEASCSCGHARPSHLHQLHANVPSAAIVPKPLLIQPIHLDALHPWLPHGCQCLQQAGARPWRADGPVSSRSIKGAPRCRRLRRPSAQLQCSGYHRDEQEQQGQQQQVCSQD